MTTSIRPLTKPRSDIGVAYGLHRHKIGEETVRAFTAELIGTFVLVFAIISTAVAATLSEPVAGASFDSWRFR
jgi:glycerol uptake facilitator-like aquaporin